MRIINVSLLSALIYVPASLLISGIFFIITLSGSHTWVTRIGGASWVFMLSMIVLMPIIIPRVKKRTGKQAI